MGATHASEHRQQTVAFLPQRTLVDLDVRLERLDRLVELALAAPARPRVLLDEGVQQELRRRGPRGQVQEAPVVSRGYGWRRRCVQ